MEDQVSHINDLEGLNSELDGFFSDLHGREEALSARIIALEEELAGVRSSSEAAMSRFTQKEAALSAALAELKSLLSQENFKAVSIASQRDALARKLDEAQHLFEEEKSRSAEKELYISTSRSVLKEKETECEKLWRAMEELKSELAFERAAVKDREAQLQKSAKAREEIERRLGQAVQEGARCEEGFALKVELLKNEVREQARRTDDLERRLAAAGSRLEEAAAETAYKEKILTEAGAALAEKDAVLKDANQRIRDLARDLEAVKAGRGRENTERAREIADSLSARVEELEAQLAESASRSLEKFRASQAALSDLQSALRAKEEENSSFRASENTLLRDLAEAEEKWKLASAQLHNAFSKLRGAENENEINAGRLKTLEEERNKFRSAAIKAEAAASAMASQEGMARDGLVLANEGLSAGAPGYLPDFEELVAGVANQMANSISIIRSHAEFCVEAPESEGARESMEVIVRNVVALQKKIDTIMNFSRPVIPQRSPERLASVVSETLAALRSSGRLKGVKVHQKGAEKLSLVSLDRVRFAAAVEQLVSNSLEAMPGGGELTVSFSSSKGKQRLEISDNGQGVERKNLGAVFHPFFTTRSGKMGLGLTLARNVVRAHGGSLELASEPGKGTTATIELPEV